MTDMIAVPIKDLKPVQLDWAVAKAVGQEVTARLYPNGTPCLSVMVDGFVQTCPHYSSDWGVGGPILTQLLRTGRWQIVQWSSPDEPCIQNFDNQCMPVDGESWEAQSHWFNGPDLLVLVCQAFVADTFGAAISVPAILVPAVQP